MSPEKVLLLLIRLALGTETTVEVPVNVDWPKVIDYAERHGLSAIAWDGLQRIYESNPRLELDLDRPSLKQQKYDWFGLVLSVEQAYEKHIRAIKGLADFYSLYGIKMMLLKGVGLSQYYPIPSHRPSGDVDIYLYGRYAEGDLLVSQELGIQVNDSSEHHTKFVFRGLSVENHYDFINTKVRRSGSSFDLLLKSIVEESSYLWKGGIYLPGPELNALFLMKHMAGHFSSEGITLRHVLDWALFVKSNYEEVNWEEFLEICYKYNTYKFVSGINSICIDYLGFDSQCFPKMKRDSELEVRILGDILGYSRESRPKGRIKETGFKIAKWWDTRWKQRICYPDSLWSSFWTSVSFNLFRHKN